MIHADSNIKCKNNQKEGKKSFIGEKIQFGSGSIIDFKLNSLEKSSSREEKTVFLGIYCLISLLAFSMAPFCQEE